VTPQTKTETEHRIEISEGLRLVAYQDSLGIWSIAYGTNLERGDGRELLAKVGATLVNPISRTTVTAIQAARLFDLDFAPIVGQARASLASGVFDALDPARQFVVCDLEYNLGQRGWVGFWATRALLNEAQARKIAGKLDIAYRLFGLCADHLAASAWDGQVGDRATRDVAMMRLGDWVPAQ